MSVPRTELKLDSVITLDKRRHQMTSFGTGEKSVIYRLHIFSITHVSKINLFWQRDIHRYPVKDMGRKIPNFILCQEVEKWQWLIVSM